MGHAQCLVNAIRLIIDGEYIYEYRYNQRMHDCADSRKDDAVSVSHTGICWDKGMKYLSNFPKIVLLSLNTVFRHFLFVPITIFGRAY